MIALAVILASIVAGALALASGMAIAALRSSSKLADARVRAAEAEGDAAASEREVDRAAVALDAMARARAREQERGDTLEAEIHELEANPVALVNPAARAGRSILREALRRAAALGPDRLDGGAPLPDAAAAGPASSPGD